MNCFSSSIDAYGIIRAHFFDLDGMDVLSSILSFNQLIFIR